MLACLCCDECVCPCPSVCVCVYNDRFFCVVQHAPHRAATPRAPFQLSGLDVVGSTM